MKAHFELKRKSVHFLGVLSIPASLYLGTTAAGFSFLGFSVALLFHSVYLEHKHRLREKNPFRVKVLEDLEDAWHGLIDSFERREHKGRFYGAIFYGLGVGLPLLLFPQKTAFLAVIALTVGDTFSTIIGRHFGRRKLFFNPKKSWEGFIACFASTFAGALLIASPMAGFLTALTASVFESLPVKGSDNLLIPFSVFLVLFFSVNYFGVVL